MNSDINTHGAHNENLNYQKRGTRDCRSVEQKKHTDLPVLDVRAVVLVASMCTVDASRKERTCNSTIYLISPEHIQMKLTTGKTRHLNVFCPHTLLLHTCNICIHFFELTEYSMCSFGVP